MSSRQRQKAEAELDRIQRHLRRIGKKSYRSLHVYINKMDRVVVYYTRTKPKTEIKAHPIKEPAEFHAEYWQVRDGGPTGGGIRRSEGSHADGTWNAAFDVIEKSSELAAKKGNTQKAYRSSLKTARAALGNARMSGTKPFHVEQFIDTAAANKQNVVNLLTVIKKAYVIGHKRGWTTCDLVAGVSLPKQTKRDDAETFFRPYMGWEIDLWRATYPIARGAAGMPRLCFELAYNLSLPRSDVVRIAPCHIGVNADGERELVAFARRKTGKAYNAVITAPDLIACLDAYGAPAEGEVVDRLGRSTAPLLRKKRSGEPYVEGHLINDDAACQRGANLIGCDWNRWRSKVPGLPADFRLHAARHTFALDGVDAEVDGRETMRTMGQSDLRVHERYKQERDAKIAGQRASRRIAKYRQDSRADRRNVL